MTGGLKISLAFLAGVVATYLATAGSDPIFLAIVPLAIFSAATVAFFVRPYPATLRWDPERWPFVADAMSAAAVIQGVQLIVFQLSASLQVPALTAAIGHRGAMAQPWPALMVAGIFVTLFGLPQLYAVLARRRRERLPNNGVAGETSGRIASFAFLAGVVAAYLASAHSSLLYALGAFGPVWFYAMVMLTRPSIKVLELDGSQRPFALDAAAASAVIQAVFLFFTALAASDKIPPLTALAMMHSNWPPPTYPVALVGIVIFLGLPLLYAFLRRRSRFARTAATT